MSNKHISISELQRMSPKELRRDILLKRADKAKLRLNIEMQVEKNHATHKREKKEIARMVMVLKNMERNGKPLPEKNPTPVTATPEKTTKKASQSAKKTVKDSGSKKKVQA